MVIVCKFGVGSEGVECKVSVQFFIEPVLGVIVEVDVC